MYPVSGETGEGREEFVRAWEPGFEQEEAARVGGERVGRLNISAGTINLVMGQI